MIRPVHNINENLCMAHSIPYFLEKSYQVVASRRLPPKPCNFRAHNPCVTLHLHDESLHHAYTINHELYYWTLQTKTVSKVMKFYSYHFCVGQKEETQFHCTEFFPSDIQQIVWHQNEGSEWEYTIISRCKLGCEKAGHCLTLHSLISVRQKCFMCSENHGSNFPGHVEAFLNQKHINPNFQWKNKIPAYSRDNQVELRTRLSWEGGSSCFPLRRHCETKPTLGNQWLHSVCNLQDPKCNSWDKQLCHLKWGVCTYSQNHVAHIWVKSTKGISKEY